MANDIVEQIKAKVRIEQVVEAEVGSLTGSGRYRKAAKHDSLVVDSANQCYYWNSNGEHGDVIAWVQRRKGLDFKSACEELCRIGGLPLPNWGREDAQTRIAARAKLDALSAAAAVMVRWLWQDEDALAYARGRGWTDETLRTAMIGYSGGGYGGRRAEMVNAMRDELSMAGVDLESPAAVAVLGWQGNVTQWAAGHGIKLVGREEWIGKGEIPGMVGRDMLVYAHVEGGRVAYLAGRGVHEKHHYNLPKELVGERKPLLNTAYTYDADGLVIVEGQADAVSLAQLGIPALAVAGCHMDADLVKRFERHTLYVGLDADAGGRKGAEKTCEAIGPMARLVTWKTDKSQKGEHDANDLLKRLKAEGMDAEAQTAYVQKMLRQATTYVEERARMVGEMQGADRDKGIKELVTLYNRLDEVSQAQYMALVARQVDLSVRDWTRILKAAGALDKRNGNGKPVAEVETLGGYIEGWLLEYVYDPATQEARLAYRNPDGEIGIREYLDIEGVRYYPTLPNAFIKQEVVLFASDLGPVKGTRELVGLIELFLRQHYLYPSKTLPKLIAYYVLLTWLYDCFNALPYLRAVGEAGAGKSEMMKRVGHLCYRLMIASGANTASTFFRATETYRGTVFIDEADLHDGGDMANDIVKFLNLGAMKGNVILRMTESVNRAGERTFEPTPFSTYCPKLIAMRKEFKDDAVATRSITMKLIPREPVELKRAGVKLMIDDTFRERAREIRNMLLHWRLMHWQPEININEDDIDLEISSRLNQVTTPLLAMAADDPELKKEIRDYLRLYNQEITLSKSMTLAARVIEAIWKIYKAPDLRIKFLEKDGNGEEYILVGNVAYIANQIVDEMNKLGDEEDEDTATDGQGHTYKLKGPGKKKDALTARGVGSIIRNELQLDVRKRMNTGYPVYWDETRMEGLAKRYGVEIPTYTAAPAPRKEEQENIPF